MSTKIYEGFKFNTDDLYEVHEYAMEFRKHALEYVGEYNTKLTANIATTEIDGQAMGLSNLKDEDKVGRAPLFLATHYIEEQRRKPNGFYSVSFEVLVFPMRDEGVILGMPFTADHDLRKIWNEGAWRDDPFITYYGYWNQTDPDENCTDEEWGERERLWHKTGVCDKPADVCGFMIEGVNKYDAMPFQMSSAVILDMVQRKSFEERVKHIAYNMAAHEKDLIRDGSTSDFMAYMRSSRNGKHISRRKQRRNSRRLSPKKTCWANETSCVLGWPQPRIPLCSLAYLGR